jgi:hypothetical protein
MSGAFDHSATLPLAHCSREAQARIHTCDPGRRMAICQRTGCATPQGPEGARGCNWVQLGAIGRHSRASAESNGWVLVDSQSILFILFILIGLPKLFIGGKVSAANLSPPPTVNNYAVAAKMICEKLKVHPKKGGHAWPGRRIVNPKRPTFKDRVSLRAKCLDAKEYSRAFRPQSLFAETNHYKGFHPSRFACPQTN